MTGKIKILSGWSNPGGSTVAHINLCNLFNDSGLDCTFYGAHKWHLDKCKSDVLSNLQIQESDTIICHYLKLDNSLFKCKKYIFSCHETDVLDLKQHGVPKCDFIHFVSESQRQWQNIDHFEVPIVVIPNVISKLTKAPLGTGKAAVIGSIDSHKQTHVSIERAWQDGYRMVYLFGNITAPAYFDREVLPLIKTGKAIHIGHIDNKQKMYNMIDAVYHSSKRETFNFVKAECIATGVAYNGLDSAESNAEYWSNDRILEAWKKII
jgi:hypothetical protein